MASGKSNALWLVVLVCVAAISLNAQSFRVQCPTTTITHPTASDTEPPYNGPTTFTTNAQGYVTPATNINGAIKCQQISGGDGYSTMADGTQTYMFSFGPLSGLTDIAAGLPGTGDPKDFNVPYPGTMATNAPLVPGDPATTDQATDGAHPGTGIGPTAPFQWNGAVGLAPEVVSTVNISDLIEGPLVAPATV